MANEIDLKKENPFEGTRLGDIRAALINQYGEKVGEHLFEVAAAIQASEVEQVDDRGSEAVRKHLVTIILPGYACYKALIAAEIPKEEAISFVQTEICKSVKMTGENIGKVKKFPFLFPLLRLFMKRIVTKSYPKHGWQIVWDKNTREEISFHITKCLYCEELKKRDAFELCPAFCITDHVAYDPLAPEIVFKRMGTLADEGNVCCDFCFLKKKR